jgi:hypothetical protein
MTTYEILDAIADSYIPLLFLGYIFFATVYWRHGDRLAAVKGFAGVLAAYALMFVDHVLQLWATVGLDYSTHSAVSYALIAFHVHKRAWNSAAAFSLCLSLILYYALEVYQRYHSVADIITTALVVGSLLGVIYWWIGLLVDRKSPATGHG